MAHYATAMQSTTVVTSGAAMAPVRQRRGPSVCPFLVTLLAEANEITADREDVGKIDTACVAESPGIVASPITT